MTKIAQAAVWFYPGDPEKSHIVTAKHHCDCFANAKQAGTITTDRNKDEDIQGFITNEGTFVDRNEAYQIAKEAGQLNNPNLCRNWLDSYDIKEGELSDGNIIPAT